MRSSFFLVCLLLGSILLTGCIQIPSSSDSIDRVLSDDTQVALEFHSLPKGIQKKDLAITRVDLTQRGISTGELAALELQGYDLQPDGAVFDEPIYVRFDYPEGLTGGVPIYIHVHDGQAVVVDGVEIVMSGEESYTRVPLTSFSELFEWKIGPNVADITFWSRDTIVGDHAPLMMTLSAHDAPIDQFRLEYRLHPGTMTLSGTIKGHMRLSPTVVSGRPPLTQIGDTYTLRSTNDLKCMSAGEAVIDYIVDLSYTADVIMPGVGFLWSDAVGENRSNTSYIRSSVKINCLPNPAGRQPPPPRCGDGYVNQASESCDTKELQGKTCRDFGYQFGLLGCTEYCDYDTSDCTSPYQRVSCSNNTWQSYNAYTGGSTRGKLCSDDCPARQKCDAKTCTCMSYQERQEKTHGTFNIDRLFHPEKYPPIPTTKKLEVIKYGISYIPADQLFKTTGQECDQQEHRHARDLVTALNGFEFIDPAPSDCGFGKTADVPVEEIDIPLTAEERAELIKQQDEEIREQEKQNEEPADEDASLPGLDE